MEGRTVNLTCRPYYDYDPNYARDFVLERGDISAGAALELFAGMFALRWNVDLKIIGLNDDEITFSHEYQLHFGGRIVGTMPADSNHYQYVYTISHGPTDSDGFWLILRLIEAIAHADPKLCSDEVRDSLGLAEAEAVPR